MVPGVSFLGAPLDFKNRSFRVRTRLTFALRADSLKRLGAPFPSLGSLPELDVGFPEFCVSPARRAYLRIRDRPWARAVLCAFRSLGGSPYKVGVFRNRSFGVRETMTFEGPGPLATRPRGLPGAIRSFPGVPPGSGTSTLGLQTFASRLRARLIYDPAGIHAPACFLCCVDFPCFLLPRQDTRFQTSVFRKLLFGLRETYTFGAPGDSRRCPGRLPGHPGPRRTAAGRPLGGSRRPLGGSGRLLGGFGRPPGDSWGLRLPLGGSLAPPDGPLAPPGAHGVAS